MMQKNNQATFSAFLNRFLGENHWLNGINWLIAFVLATAFLAAYYYANIGNIDRYGQFIFGDTIYQEYSKTTDIRLVPYWFVFFILANLLVLGIRHFVEKNIIIDRSKQLAQFLFSHQDRFLAAGIVLLSCYFYYLILRIFAIKNGLSNTLIILLTLIFMVAVLTKHYRTTTLLSQTLLVFTPLLYLYEVYVYQGETIVFPLSPFRIAFFALLSAYLLFSHYRHWKTQQFFSNAMLFFIAILTIGAAKRFYLDDEYHMGEIFTAYHQIFTLGQAAYSEYIPTKGFMPVLDGWVNQLFFDGGYLSIWLAIKCVLIGKIFVLLLLTNYLKTNKLLVLFLITSAVYLLHAYYYPMLLALLLFSHPAVFQNHFRFIACFAYFSVGYFFYYNAFAVVFILSLFPLFAYHAVKYIKQLINEGVELKQLVILFVPVLFLLINLSLVLASLEYLLVNSSANLFYWGNSGKFGKFLDSNLWVLFYGWLLFALLKRKIPINGYTVPWLLLLLISPFLLLSYLEGRADGEFLRAKSYASFISICLICLSAIFYTLKQNRMTVLLMIIGLLGFFLTNGKLHLSFKSGAYSFAKSYIAPPFVLNNQPNLNLGHGFLPEAKQEALKHEAKLFDYLLPEENFLVVGEYMTQSARYSIMNKKIPTISHAVLNIPSLSAWKKELEKVKQSQVKIVRVSSGIKRYMLLYNELMSRDFSLISYYGRYYLVAPEILQRITGNLVFEKLNTEDGFKFAGADDFGLLPIKWGSAVAKERDNMQHLFSFDLPAKTNDVTIRDDYYRLGNNDSFWVYESSLFDGEKANILTFSINGLENRTCLAIFSWRSGKKFRSPNFVVFKIKNGQTAVPLGMNYHWIRQKNIQALRLDIDGCGGADIKLSPLNLYKY